MQSKNTQEFIRKTKPTPPKAYNLIKRYILFFISTSSILDVVLKIVEPDGEVSDDIFGYTLICKKYPIITIEMQCPNSCNLPSILGKANQIAKETIKTKVELINAIKLSPDLARVITSYIREKIMIPKMIFCFVLMLGGIGLLHLNMPIIPFISIIIGYIYLIITGFQTTEIDKLSNYSLLETKAGG